MELGVLGVLARPPTLGVRLDRGGVGCGCGDPYAQMARVKACEQWLLSKDAPVLAAAIMCAADVLVTGDRRHFKPLWGRIVEGVIVLTPRQALERVLVSGAG